MLARLSTTNMNIRWDMATSGLPLCLLKWPQSCKGWNQRHLIPVILSPVSLPAPAAPAKTGVQEEPSQLPGQQRWTCDPNQQPVITSLPRGLFVQTGRNVIPLLQRTGQEEPSGLWRDSTAASLCWDAPFCWSYIKNGSQGQVGYSQSRQVQVCCLVGNEACLGLSLLIILPGIQLGDVFWIWRHTSGHLSLFQWFPHWRPL